MKTKYFLITILAVMLSLTACSKEDKHQGHEDHSGHGHEQHMSKTKLVVNDNIQAAFDLMTSADHNSMMKMMGIEKMKHDADSDQFISITLVDKGEKKLIKNADVKIKVTGPDNKTIEKAPHEMSGKGMFHYVSGFNMKASGVYKVKADATIGGKNYAFETEYKI